MTENSITAVDPAEADEAERTTSRCADSTPAALHNRPTRSGATTVTAPPFTRTAPPPCRASDACSADRVGGLGGGDPASTDPDEEYDPAEDERDSIVGGM